MSDRSVTRRRRPSMSWAQRPWGAVRWIVLGGTVPSMVAVAFAATGADAFTWVFVLGGVPGLLAGLRMLGVPTAGATNPYLFSSALGPNDMAPPLRRYGGDLMWALIVWLGAGLITAGVAVALDGDPSMLFMPFALGLLWVMGACVGAVVGLLLLYPISLLLAYVVSRRSGRRFHRGWLVGATALLLLLVWGVTVTVASVALLGETPESAGRGKAALGWITFGDVSSFSPGLQIAAWTSRLLLLAIAGVIVFAWLDGRGPRGRERDELRTRASDRP